MRCITERQNGKYKVAQGSTHIGTFDTIEEALQARKNAIESGKISLIRTVKCLDCGIKFVFRNTVGSSQRRRCAKCKAKHASNQLTNYLLRDHDD